MDSEFKRYHLTIFDILEKEEELEPEQATFDEHDDMVTDLFNRLATPEECEVKARIDPWQHLHRRSQHVEQNPRKVTVAVSSAAEQANVDGCLLEQLDEQVNGFELEVFDMSRSISIFGWRCS